MQTRTSRGENFNTSPDHNQQFAFCVQVGFVAANRRGEDEKSGKMTPKINLGRRRLKIAEKKTMGVESTPRRGVMGYEEIDEEEKGD